MKLINVKKNEDGEAYIDLSDFADMVDISKVAHYSLEEVDSDGTPCLILQFFDKDCNIVGVK